MDGGHVEGRMQRRGAVTAAVLVVVLVVGLAVGLPIWLRDGRGDDGPGADRSATGTLDGGECTGTLRAAEVDGDLTVPPGERCRLLGVAVLGHTSVGAGATLYARSSWFGKGLHARGHERVAIVDGPVPGRTDWWRADYPLNEVEAVIEGGRDVLLLEGGYTDYLIRRNTGRVEIRDIYFDLGSADCRGNTREPIVRGISAETPGVLKGQCAGLKNFGPSDF